MMLTNTPGIQIMKANFCYISGLNVFYTVILSYEHNEYRDILNLITYS